MNNVIYFDNAATTFPKPPQVIEEAARCMREYCGNPGRGSHKLALLASEKLYECRAEVAGMFGAALPENVVFTQNTTYAINIALKSYIPRGAHILISDMEHNAVLRPVLELHRRGALTYDIFPTSGSSAQILAGIRNRIRKNTAAVICTLASNICSKAIPVKCIGNLCRSNGILFIADGAQAAGHMEINMADEGIDILCLPGHKGLYGPQGIGMMITAVDKTGRTVIEGGSGADSRNPEMPEYLPERFEAGTQNTPAAAGLIEGMKFVKEMGICRIRSHECELWYRLYSKLRGDKRFRIYGEHQPSSVMLINRIGTDPSALGRHLNEHGICVRSGLHCAPLAHDTIGTGETGGVRISFSIFNTAKEIDCLCDILART